MPPPQAQGGPYSLTFLGLKPQGNQEMGLLLKS